jgi:hypothetical protein
MKTYIVTTTCDNCGKAEGRNMGMGFFVKNAVEDGLDYPDGWLFYQGYGVFCSEACSSYGMEAYIPKATAELAETIRRRWTQAHKACFKKDTYHAR